MMACGVGAPNESQSAGRFVSHYMIDDALLAILIEEDDTEEMPIPAIPSPAQPESQYRDTSEPGFVEKGKERTPARLPDANLKKKEA